MTDHTVHGGGAESVRRGAGLLTLIAFIALALNLRSPLTAIPPVIDGIRGDLGIGATMAGLTTSIPVLCFGVLAPFASVLIARTGIQSAICLALAGAFAGMAFRPYTGVSGMIGGTLLIGASLAIGNIVALMVIARDFAARTGLVTGIYTAALNVGALLTGALTAPIAEVAGWRLALSGWSWFALLAMALWIGDGLVRRDRRREPFAAAPNRVLPKVAESPKIVESQGHRATAAGGPLLRRPSTWLLTAAFSTHLFIYYGITAWLPAYLVEASGMTRIRAGLVASSFQALALIGSFAVPVLARRFPLGPQLALMGALWLVTPVLMLLYPDRWYVWALTGGITQGGCFVLIFMLIMRLSGSLDENRRLSSVVQGVGYSLSALGPVVVGALHGHWGMAWTTLSLCSVAVIIAGIALSRGKD